MKGCSQADAETRSTLSSALKGKKWGEAGEIALNRLLHLPNVFEGGNYGESLPAGNGRTKAELYLFLKHLNGDSQEKTFDIFGSDSDVPEEKIPMNATYSRWSDDNNMICAGLNAIDRGRSDIAKSIVSCAEKLYLPGPGFLSTHMQANNGHLFGKNQNDDLPDETKLDKLNRLYCKQVSERHEKFLLLEHAVKNSEHYASWLKEPGNGAHKDKLYGEVEKEYLAVAGSEIDRGDLERLDILHTNYPLLSHDHLENRIDDGLKGIKNKDSSIEGSINHVMLLLALGENDKANRFALGIKGDLTRYGFPYGTVDSQNPVADAVTIQRIFSLTDWKNVNLEFIDRVVEYGEKTNSEDENSFAPKLWSELVFLGDEIDRPDIVELSKERLVKGVISRLGSRDHELIPILPAISGLFGIKNQGIMRYYHTL